MELEQEQKQDKNTITDKELIELLGVQQYKSTYFAVFHTEKTTISQEFDSLEKAQYYLARIAANAPHAKVAIIERTVIHTVRHA